MQRARIGYPREGEERKRSLIFLGAECSEVRVRTQGSGVITLWGTAEMNLRDGIVDVQHLDRIAVRASGGDCSLGRTQDLVRFALAAAICLFGQGVVHAETSAIPQGTWAGGFWIGERCIPYIVRITAHAGRATGNATLDRIDGVRAPEPASSVTLDDDSLRIAFAGAGSDPWEFILRPDSTGLAGSLLLRNRSEEHRFPAAFNSMQDVETEDLARHVGLYEADGGARVRISSDEDGTLIAHLQQEDRFQMLFPSGPDRFFAGSGPTCAVPPSVTTTFSHETLDWTEAGASQAFVRIAETNPPMTLTDGAIRRGDLTLPLAPIPAGSFLMGQQLSNEETVARLGLKLPDDIVLPKPSPLRRTTLTQAFLMSRFEVTNAWFAAFVDETGYMTDAERAGYGLVWNGEGFDRTPGITWREPGVDAPADAPVVFVSWNDASALTAWLSRRLGRVVRLPTEAEWEYACAAGTVTMFSCGDDTLQLDAYAWSNRNATAANSVGSKGANPWGLYDMHGNVWEWCLDGHEEISDAPAVDPTGAPESRTRDLRGGSWINGPWSLRTSVRAHESPTLAEPHIGFRCVVETKK